MLGVNGQPASTDGQGLAVLPTSSSKPLTQAPLAHAKHLNLYPNYCGKMMKIKMFFVDAHGQHYFLSPGHGGSGLPPANLKLHKS